MIFNHTKTLLNIFISGIFFINFSIRASSENVLEPGTTINEYKVYHCFLNEEKANKKGKDKIGDFEEEHNEEEHNEEEHNGEEIINKKDQSYITEKSIFSEALHGNPSAQFYIGKTAFEEWKNDPSLHNAADEARRWFAKIVENDEYDEKEESQEAKVMLQQLGKALPVKTINQPLVNTDGENYKINSDFLELFTDLKCMLDLSYVIVKNHDLCMRYQLNNKGWKELKTFSGKTGGIFNDLPGFTCYNTSHNIIAVVFHGSRNMADWLTNINVFPKKATRYNLPENYHWGFLKKYTQCRGNLVKNIEEIFGSLSTKNQKSLRFIVTGHSQGAALAEIASIDLTKNFLKEKYGVEFDNTIENKLFGWYLSPPSIAPLLHRNKETVEVCNRVVGKNNMIWHTVLYDLVNLYGYAQIPGKLPLIGKKIARLLRLSTPGHLALEHLASGWRKEIKRTITQSLSKIKARDFDALPLDLIIPLITQSWSKIIAPSCIKHLFYGEGGAFDHGLINPLEEAIIKGHRFQKQFLALSCNVQQ